MWTSVCRCSELAVKFAGWVEEPSQAHKNRDYLSPCPGPRLQQRNLQLTAVREYGACKFGSQIPRRFVVALKAELQEKAERTRLAAGPLPVTDMAGVDFVLVLQVVAFLCAIWLGGRLFKICHQPAILGYLLVGIVMGPQLLDMVPYASDGTQPW